MLKPGGQSQLSSASTASSKCSADTTEGIEVTARCVGPIPIDSPLAYAVAHLPRPRVDTGYLETTPVVVWYFDLPGLTAMVSQQDITMDLKSPAFEWHLSGPDVLLPGKVPLPANWGQLRSRFPGPATLAIDELGAWAEVCSLSGVWLKLNFYYDGYSRDTMTAQSIPSDARIEEVAVYPGRQEQCP